MNKVRVINWKDPASVPPRQFKIRGESLLFEYHGGINDECRALWEKRRIMAEGHYYIRLLDRGEGKDPRYVMYRRRIPSPSLV